MRKYIEVSCDTCGQANHASTGRFALARLVLSGFGLIFSKHGEFCDKECFDIFKRDMRDAK